MTSRTEGAIALLPVGNLAGSCKFFKLATKQVVTRDQWTPLPMPDNVISYMNKFADEQSKARQTTVSADPKFYLHGREISDAPMEDEEQPAWEEEPTHLVQDLGEEEVVPAEDEAPIRPVTRSASARAHLDQDHLAAREAAFGGELAAYGSAAQLGGAPSQRDEDANAEDHAPDHMEAPAVSLRGARAYDDDDDDDDNPLDFPLEEWYDLGEQGPDEDDAAPTEEIQRNIEQLHQRHSYGLRPRVDGRASNHPTGYNLRQRVKGSYVSGKFVPERDEIGLHIKVKKALSMYKRKALVELYRELMQMDKKRVFHPRDPKTLTRKQLKAVIRSSIFLKEKYLPSGEFEKLKARLVAGGTCKTSHCMKTSRPPR
jgi:hypothetical protein